MTEYRLYVLESGHRISWFLDIDVPTKQAAIEQARASDHGHGVELWRGRRKVGVFRGDPADIALVQGGKAP